MQGGEPQLPEGVTLGDVFAGRYRLDSIIGWGAMGIVVAGHDRRLDIPVAIKFLVAAAPERRDAVRRFVGEAQAAAQLQSEHVVRVTDVALHDDRIPYIVMELLKGRDLATALRAVGRFSTEEAVDYVLEACEAVAEAHRKDIVHRDLKPANLFLVDREQARPALKILDFGVAKRSSMGDTSDWHQSIVASETGPKAVLGSPFYMSPEQMESSGDVDPRTDIWALGITLYELVMGEPPYRGTTLIQLYSRITLPGEHAWKAHLGERAPGLVPIVARCLERDRARRYPSVAELARDLAPFGSKASLDSEARIRLGAQQASLLGVDATVNVVTPRSLGSSSSRHSPAPQTASIRIVRPARRWAGPTSLAVFVAGGLVSAMLVRRPWQPLPAIQATAPALVSSPAGPPSTAVAPSSAPLEAPIPSSPPSARVTSAAGLLPIVRPPPPPEPRPRVSVADAGVVVVPPDAAPVARPASAVSLPSDLADASYGELKPLLEKRH